MGSEVPPSPLDSLIASLDREGRNEARVLVNIPGRYQLASKRKLNGDRREFACRIVNLSASAMGIAAPVLGPVGERAIVYTDALGQLHGAILRQMSTGFVMSIVADAQTRERVATKVSWLAKQQDEPETTENRRHARIVPKNPTATILLADGSLVSCLVIDYSASGAAVGNSLDNFQVLLAYQFACHRTLPREREHRDARQEPASGQGET